MKRLISCIIFLFGYVVQAQHVFTEAHLVTAVKQFHPLSKYASLNVRIADANIRAARGSFDPVLNYENSRKDFGGTNYYNQQLAELRLPTWYGIDLYAGIERMEGDRLNPEITEGRVNYIGVSVPLVQNVLMDKRRAALQQAKILAQSSEMAKRAAVNDLVAEALTAYWDWWEKYHTLRIVQEAVQNAKVRLNMVKTMYQLGERPAIDTLEAATQVRLFEQIQTDSERLLEKSRLQLSLYLWSERETGYDLPKDATPELMPSGNIPTLDSLTIAASNQPLLIEYDYKLKELGIEKQLKFQSLLPEVKAKYNSLGRTFTKSFNDAFLNTNYRFGVGFSMPLRLSQGRGELQAARFKIEQTKLMRSAKLREIQTKVNQLYIDWQQTQIQLGQQQDLVQNYTSLRKAEETRFANGESSLFLINSREAATIEAQRKQLALAAKLQQAWVQLRWAAGMFGN